MSYVETAKTTIANKKRERLESMVKAVVMSGERLFPDAMVDKAEKIIKAIDERVDNDDKSG